VLDFAKALECTPWLKPMYSLARRIIMRMNVKAPVSERFHDPPRGLSFLIDSLFILLI